VDILVTFHLCYSFRLLSLSYKTVSIPTVAGIKCKFFCVNRLDLL